MLLKYGLLGMRRSGRRAGDDSAACLSDGGKDGKDPILTRRLLQKHQKEVKDLEITLVLGKTYSYEEEEKLVRVKGGSFSVLGKRPKGGSVITHYHKPEEAAYYESRPIGRR